MAPPTRFDFTSTLGVTFLSDYPNSDTYYRLRRYDGNAFHIDPHGTTVAGVIDSGGRGGGVHGDPDELAPCLRQLGDLAHRGLDVRRIGVGHRLHHHGVLASDLHIAHRHARRAAPGQQAGFRNGAGWS